MLGRYHGGQLRPGAGVWCIEEGREAPIFRSPPAPRSMFRSVGSLWPLVVKADKPQMRVSGCLLTQRQINGNQTQPGLDNMVIRLET